MTDKSAREVITQALFDYGGGGGGADCDLVDLFESVCHDQTQAILAALEAGGFVVVPKEPPRWVLDMAHHQIEDCRERGCDEVALHVWQFIREATTK